MSQTFSYDSIIGALCDSPEHAGASNIVWSISKATEQMITAFTKVVA
ncbi:hypothetical protein V7O67_05290 [Methanolobus sp. ZRKC4]